MANFVIATTSLAGLAGIAFAGSLTWKIVTSQTIEEHQCVIVLLVSALALVASMITLGSVFANVVGK